MQFGTLCFWLLLVSAIGVSSHSKNKLRHTTQDVDDDVDDDDVGAPAPAAIVPAGPAPAPAVATTTPVLQPIVQSGTIDMHEMMVQAEEMFDTHGVSDPKHEHKEQLAGLMYIEELYQDKLQELNDENYAKKIEKEEVPVANETSPGLASMLGEMREEMHDYAVPFYKKFLKEKIKEVQKQQHVLVAQIAEEHDDGSRSKSKQKTKATIQPASVKSAKPESNLSNLLIWGLVIIIALAAIVWFAMRRKSNQNEQR